MRLYKGSLGFWRCFFVVCMLKAGNILGFVVLCNFTHAFCVGWLALSSKQIAFPTFPSAGFASPIPFAAIHQIQYPLQKARINNESTALNSKTCRKHTSRHIFANWQRKNPSIWNTKQQDWLWVKKTKQEDHRFWEKLFSFTPNWENP